MNEQTVSIAAAVELAGVVCLPEHAPADRVPGVLILAGSGANTRDGDLVLEAAEPSDPPHPGTMRRIAHALAAVGVASLRFDKRGFGESGGDPEEVDYDTDLVDAKACLAWFRDHDEIDRSRVAVAGHSAGALTTCHVCRDVPDVAAAGLLGALASPIEDMLRWNVGRLRNHWDRFTDEQRAWLEAKMPNALARANAVEELLEAGRSGTGTGSRNARLRQDLATDYAAEMRHVTCPALVLHGGADLNVPVEDALTTYGRLRQAGNDGVTLVILPGLDHYFIRVPEDPDQRVWERVSQQAWKRPVAPEALETIATWAVRVLAPTAG